jgi:hypothetical protein
MSAFPDGRRKRARERLMPANPYAPPPLWRRYTWIVVAISLVLTGNFLGPFAMTRLFGAYWMAAAVWLAFSKEVPFSLGSTEVLRLKGWRKIFIILPLMCIGIAMIVYAPEFTCSMRGYKTTLLCAR